MNDEKSIEESKTLESLASTNGQATGQADYQQPDLRRRRLIRGAAGIAPVVITLRSGSLAAASSCVGAIAFGHIDNDGKFVTDTLSPGAIISNGDKCVTAYNSSGCSTGKILPQSVSGAQAPGNLNTNSGKCEKNGTQVIGPGANVALVSASSTSFV